MPVQMNETRLPGVGVKYALPLAGGGRLSVILHNDGKRELYFFRRGRRRAARGDHARRRRGARLGAVIGGAYERPKIVEELEMALGELQIEWVPVPETSPCIGKTLGELGFRKRTGVTVIAILREPEPMSGAQADDVLQQGDTVVTVGKAGQYGRFRRLLASGSPD